ncbi:DNA polymerase III subunit delta' [bacterium]|nr:DNA polymerase III subunit delta' [bacterium]
MKLTDIAGNKRIVEYFQRALKRKQLGHAYLFSGPAGVGKSTLAAVLCKTLLCKNPDAEGPCSSCVSCHKFDSGNHPDFHQFIAEGLYFKIDLIRQIIHQASLKPVESSWKTFLLEDVDYMRDEAANAFLKVLEEPPGQTIFFLICERSEGLLSTIRSRCQIFEFQPLQPEEIKQWLIKKNNIGEQDAAYLSLSTHGSPGKALSVNPEQYQEMRDKVLVALETAILPKTYYTLIDAVRAITVDRTEMVERLLILEELARDLILLKSSSDARLVHEDARKRLAPLMENLDLRLLDEFYDELLQVREAILKINANISLSLQSLLLPLKMKCDERRATIA